MRAGNRCSKTAGFVEVTIGPPVDTFSDATVRNRHAPSTSTATRCALTHHHDKVARRLTIEVRTGPIEIDDTLLTWEKRLD